jgi:hypothetical protein
MTRSVRMPRKFFVLSANTRANDTQHANATQMLCAVRRFVCCQQIHVQMPRSVRMPHQICVLSSNTRAYATQRADATKKFCSVGKYTCKCHAVCAVWFGVLIWGRGEGGMIFLASLLVRILNWVGQKGWSEPYIYS